MIYIRKLKPLITVIIALLVTIIVFAGCTVAKKSTISANGFRVEMENRDYSVSEQLVTANYVVASLSASDKQNIKVDYYEFEDEDSASSFFDSIKASIKELDLKPSKDLAVNISNYSKYELSTKSEYYIVTKVENTVIYCRTTSDHKKDVQTILKKFGYL